MSYQEKRSLTNIVSSVVITGVYAIVMYQRYLNGAFDTSNVMSFWAMLILIFIPISVIARIIIMILFHISEAVVKTAKGEELDIDEVTDERDKMISLRANNISMMIFVVGFIVALATQLFDVSNHVFFILIITFGLITDIVSETFTILYYRRGI